MRFLDSNVFIYHLLKDLRYGRRAREILEYVERGQETAVPIIAITQVCAYLKWRKLPDAIPIFIALLQSLPTLNKEETMFSDYISAFSLRERLHLHWSMWNDLVISSQMQRLGIREIYSFDSDFDKIPMVKRLH